jgi:salicylate hydroxylase
MALEDAVSFSHRCGTEGDLDKALALYLEDRMVRTSRVVIDSRLIGDHIYHPSGAAAALRNSVMRSLSTEQWYEKLGWLYDGGRPKS